MPSDNVETATATTLGEAFREYVQTLKPEQRRIQENYVRKYVESVGPDRLIDDVISGAKVETYAEKEIRSSDPAANERVAALKAWFQFLKKREYTKANFGVNVRVRKTPGRPIAVQRGTTFIAEPIEMSAAELLSRKEQLDALNAERAAQVVLVDVARQEGDLRENAGYHAAREGLGMIDGRKAKLEDEIKRAVVVDRQDDGKSNLGSTVTCTNLDEDKQLQYTLVNAREANLKDGKISVESPVGKQLLNKRPGDEVKVTTPRGELRFRVDSVRQG